MMPRKKRIAIIIAMISIILLVVFSILIYLIVATDTFKSNKELFEKYAFKTFENFENFLTSDTQNSLNNDKYTSEAQLKINYVTNMNTTAENQTNDLNSTSLNINSQVDKNNNYDYKEIYLEKDSEKLGSFEYIQDDDIYGIHLSGIKQYVSVKNNNLKELAEDLDLTDEQISYIPNTISDINFDISDIKFTEEEKEQIASTYANVISDNVSKDNFSKQKSALITVGDKDVNTNAYTLTLNKEQYNNLKIKLLEQLAKDEIILSKLSILQDKITEFYPMNSIDYEQKYVDEINNIIKEIQDTNIGQEEVKITVYENLKQTVRILIDDKTTKTTLDFIGQNPNITIEATITKYDTVENSMVAVIEKVKQDNQNKFSVSFERIKSEETQKLEFILIDINNNNSMEREISLSYNNGTNQISLNIDNEINLVKSFEQKEELTNENNIILNDLDKEKAKIIIGKLKNKASKQLNSIYDKINTDDITEAFSIFSMGETITVGDGEITENQKNRFNSQFEFYQGDEVETSDIKALLSTLKNNTSKAEIVSDDKDNIKIRIFVESGKKDDNGILKIEELLDENDNKGKKYKVRISYGDNGLINGIAITYTKE